MSYVVTLELSVSLSCWVQLISIYTSFHASWPLLSILLSVLCVISSTGEEDFWNTDFCFAAQAAMSCSGGPTGGPGGLCHGAFWNGGKVWWWWNQPAALAASFKPANILCALSVCQFSTHGLVPSSKGMVRLQCQNLYFSFKTDLYRALSRTLLLVAVAWLSLASWLWDTDLGRRTNLAMHTSGSVMQKVLTPEAENS